MEVPVIRLVADDSPATRLDRLTPRPIITDDSSHIDDSDVKAEMQAEWEKDWQDQGVAGALIVANAKANVLSPLVSADEHIRRNYPRAIW